MNTRQTKNQEIVQQIHDLIKTMKVAHPEAVLFVTTLDDPESEKNTRGSVAVGGCVHGLTVGLYNAMNEPEVAEAMKLARKRFKADNGAGSQRTGDDSGIPANPVPKNHPLHGLLEKLRDEAVEIKRKMDAAKVN